jgi:predicted nucleic acid-binding protein
LVDASVFVAAIHRQDKVTGTRRLLTHLVNDPRVSLVANPYLVQEYLDHSAELESEKLAELVELLLDKCELLEVESRFVTACAEVIGKDDPADLMHAATCLKLGAILIARDKRFDALKKKNMVEVWSIEDAMLKFGLIRVH